LNYLYWSVETWESFKR